MSRTSLALRLALCALGVGLGPGVIACGEGAGLSDWVPVPGGFQPAAGNAGAPAAAAAGAAGQGGATSPQGAGMGGSGAVSDAGSLDAAAPAAGGGDDEPIDGGTRDGGGQSPEDAGSDAGSDAALDAGPDDPSWPPPPATEELRALPATLAAGICEAIEDCLGPTLTEITFDASDCAARTEAELRDGDFVYLQASIDAASIAFDPDAVAQCAADYAALGCDVLRSRAPASCKAMLAGQVPSGAACVLDDDCAAGTFCDRSAACPGACRAPLAEGASCDRNDQCQDGLQCLRGRCAEPALVGEACGGGVAEDCHLGLFCVGDDPAMDQAGACEAQSTLFERGQGESCDVLAGAWCEEGLACVVDVIGSGSSATVSTVCLARVASGAECHTSVLPQQCPAGEHCPADLNPDYIADCAPRPADGEPCGPFRICAPDHYCDGTHCRTLNRRLGQACTLAGQCVSQRCEPAPGGGRACAPQPRCRLDDEEPVPRCGDATCDAGESCQSCAEDCGACPSPCGDGTCGGDESCASCAQDCGACPAPYSGPCDADADCAPSQRCVRHRVPGLLGLPPDTHYGYCAEPCAAAAECTGPSAQRACTSGGACVLQCSLFECALLNQARCCPVGMECIESACTHRL